MKKTYVTPMSVLYAVHAQSLLDNVSFSADGDNNLGVTLGGDGGNETYDGEFNAKRRDPWKDGCWADEELPDDEW